MKQRLDQVLFARGLVTSRSQAESWIRLGKAFVNGKAITKPGVFVDTDADVQLQAPEQYVSRAGLKLASVAKILHLEFADKVMLDVGSSTGGFTDYALQHGARKVYAVDVGTEQLHPSLRNDPRIELYEQTDIRSVLPARSALRTHAQTSVPASTVRKSVVMTEVPDVVVIDVSFISLRDILPHITTLCGPETIVAAMVKPQFEAGESGVMHKGVIKNDKIRRTILKDFEGWVTTYFVILDKADSEVAGTKGNRERFYKLRGLATERTIHRR